MKRRYNKKGLTERFVTLKHIDIHNKIGGNSMTREECEEKLAEMIVQVKVQIKAEKDKMTG